jgi:hypothetical protein
MRCLSLQFSFAFEKLPLILKIFIRNTSNDFAVYRLFLPETPPWDVGKIMENLSFWRLSEEVFMSETTFCGIYKF